MNCKWQVFTIYLFHFCFRPLYHKSRWVNIKYFPEISNMVKMRETQSHILSTERGPKWFPNHVIFLDKKRSKYTVKLSNNLMLFYFYMDFKFAPGDIYTSSLLYYIQVNDWIITIECQMRNFFRYTMSSGIPCLHVYHVFRYTMERTNYLTMRWWSCPLCTRQKRLVGFL